jgi:hypothetical protein
VVYGDDIAVDTRTTDDVIAILERLGFTVNVSKSFTGSQSFRESCGVFAFEGHDVTPLLFRIPFFNKGKPDAKVYDSFIGAINWAGDNGYRHYATYLLKALEGMRLSNPLPFKTDKEGYGIFTNNKHVVEERYLRYNAEWQILDERVQGIGNRPIRMIRGGTSIHLEVSRLISGVLKKVTVAQPDNLEEYRYNQWWRSRIGGSTLLGYTRSPRIRPQETRLVPRWARYE